MLDCAGLSSRYTVRPLGEDDAEEILSLCRENTQFYLYCQARPSREQVLRDLRVTPPGIDPADKHYLGFYEGERLTAVLDLVDGYPEPCSAYIGFFMMRRALQGQGLGSALIREIAASLKSAGKDAILLAIDKGNPQSTHFWKKNGFRVIREADRGEWTALVTEKRL